MLSFIICIYLQMEILVSLLLLLLSWVVHTCTQKTTPHLTPPTLSSMIGLVPSATLPSRLHSLSSFEKRPGSRCPIVVTSGLRHRGSETEPMTQLDPTWSRKIKYLYIYDTDPQ